MAQANASLAELEKEIGLEPIASNLDAIEALLRSDKQVIYRSLLKMWLAKQGIPTKFAQQAIDSSVAKGYCIRPYLLSWRKRINPGFDLLGGDASDDLDFAPPQEKPKAPEPAQNAVQTEAWLKVLFSQVERAVEALTKEKLDKAVIRLDPTARDEIKSLAKSAAQNLVETLMPPRQIEIHDKERGKVIPLGLQHEKFPTLLRAVQARDHRGFHLNIWLTGPTGSGKTTAAENVSKALSLPFGSDGSLDADYKVLGFRDANGNVISTQFLDIYENGGIYVADEIDNWLPSALLSLNAALANGWVSSPKGLIKRHPDACVIACANTWGLGATSDYVGRTKLDAASLDRFHPKINWPVDEKLEAAVAEQCGGSLGTDWHHTVRTTRELAQKQGLKIIVSPRATFNGIALLKEGFTRDEVIEMTLAAGLSAEQVKAVGLEKKAIQLNTQSLSSSSSYSSVEEVKRLYDEGQTSAAIRLYRDIHGVGLMAAENAIAAYGREKSLMHNRW